ncbi:hypothetical protein V1477_000320 [Vespula maculifrons]|uniref:Uncharacterized protein n=1 Tax=Vespula maculifrons TaxID=7453 RepID=A0ABD2D1A1_VESMC
MYLADCIVKNLGRSLEDCNVSLQSTKTFQGKSLKGKGEAEEEEKSGKVGEGRRVTAPSVSGAKIRNEERVGVERGCGGGGEGGRVPWLSELARINTPIDFDTLDNPLITLFRLAQFSQDTSSRYFDQFAAPAKLTRFHWNQDRLPEEVRRLLASSGELRVELIADANEKAERAAEERIFQRRPAAPAEMRRLCLSINMRHETRRNRIFAFETRDNKEKGWLGDGRGTKRDCLYTMALDYDMHKPKTDVCIYPTYVEFCSQAVKTDFETTFGNNTAAAYIVKATFCRGVSSIIIMCRSY